MVTDLARSHDEQRLADRQKRGWWAGRLRGSKLNPERVRLEISGIPADATGEGISVRPGVVANRLLG